MRPRGQRGKRPGRTAHQTDTPSPEAIDRLVNEWARADNRVIAGPTEFDHAGAHGVHGRWSILASYRRLLAGLQLRNDGVTDVRRIRLLLWTSGRGGDARLAAEDLAHVFRKIAAHAGKTSL